MAVYVISNNGERLMPTTRYGRVRHLLKEGKACIVKRKPFTIQLTYESGEYVQAMELCIDSGAQHIGLSLKSESREYESIQFDLLEDEKERHDDCRKYRHTRRNRLRYRKLRFDNRRREKGSLAPSLENKANRHIDIICAFAIVAPVTDVYFEAGQFDIQLLAAFQEGKPIPQGTDYQHGERYKISTLREAVFQRDYYKCRFCERSALDSKDRAILHAHHVYYWRGQHGDRLEELAACCEKCHTSANHKEGGKLWGYDQELPRFTGAAFMNSVKWYIYNTLADRLSCNVHLTYGAATKLARADLKLEKSHVNDAYAMGKMHPAVRAQEQLFQKCRRNNRILEKFYDAKIVDIRTGKIVKGAKLGCERTNRRESRTSEKSLRRYRGEKVSKGRRVIRRTRYSIRPGDVIKVGSNVFHAKGVHCNGNNVIIAETGKSASLSKVKVICHTGGWKRIQQKKGEKGNSSQG